MLNTTKIKVIVSAVLCTVLAILLPTSCDVYDDLDPCPRGVNLRFVFDYNMEFANAFPQKVDCYKLYIYDEEGKFLKSYSEEGEKLRDENYRLQIDLPHGNYKFVAYGGMACAKHSFAPVEEPGEGKNFSTLKVLMQNNNLTSDQLLHDFYYGYADITVSGEMYNDNTIYLKRNTNSIRILLQQMDGSPVDMNLFNVSITDDNTLFDNQNNLIPNGQITYLPWSFGESKPDSNDDTVKAGYAEFSTSRLSVNSDNRLIVRRAMDDGVVLSIPLNKYLLLLKSERYASMGAQEFLDRESDWVMIFFLDANHKWVHTQIVINDWIVKLNDFDL